MINFNVLVLAKIVSNDLADAHGLCNPGDFYHMYSRQEIY